ncbi:MAG TPA: apolipoprotein N-acyltransferase [Rubrivivax sp.]|nr:apolipoprotein N-acyltransferase [Rubrivivax sp.]
MLAGVYVRGGAGWMLGFLMFVPWLRSMDGTRGLAATLLSALVMTLAYTAAAFAWFGFAIGRFTGLGDAVGLAVLLGVAPLLQPQFIALALVRRLVGRWRGGLLASIAGAATWVATEALWPKLLGDTLGHGLHPSALMRQGAAVGGPAGLTLLLLLTNEALAAAWRRRGNGLRAIGPRLASAALIPALLATHGAFALTERAPPGSERLRVGLVQAAIVDYEERRREKGSAEVVRELLDTHYAMSWDAVERQGVQAVLWSETVYPTTLGQPKSEAGAEFDREIGEIVDAAGVPFVLGTYTRDPAGEYNAAAFLAPGQGLVGFYRKTRLFPFTEAVPAWLDGPRLRRWLPWTGAWQPGDGARVLPLWLSDGREIPALPLICLDAVDPMLAIQGARLGARVILSMSNDSWFTEHPLGARLHLAVAAFRSIETGLPQFRVTANGVSAVIDAHGEILAQARMGERTLVVGELPVPEPAPTAMVRLGDWVGYAAAAFLAMLALLAAVQALHSKRPSSLDADGAIAARLPAGVALLPPAARWAAAALAGLAQTSLLSMALAALLGSSLWPSNTFAQLRAVAVWVLAPQLASWFLLRAYRARAQLDGKRLEFVRGSRRIGLALEDLAAIEAWRLPWPSVGSWLRLGSGARWPHGVAGLHAESLALALAQGGVHTALQAPDWVRHRERALRTLRRRWFDRAWAKFALLPLLLAIPAFRLHQHIVFGSSFGEIDAFGLVAYLKGFALWWAAWAIGVAQTAAVLRALVELGALAAAIGWPAAAATVRRALERAALALLYLGIPAWLAWRVLAS